MANCFCTGPDSTGKCRCQRNEELLGAIARGWCSQKNSHKTMDPDLAGAIFDEVEQHIKQYFRVKE